MFKARQAGPGNTGRRVTHMWGSEGRPGVGRLAVVRVCEESSVHYRGGRGSGDYTKELLRCGGGAPWW